MEYVILGRTGLNVSRIALGAGPVSGLMTGDDQQLQLETLQRVIQVGINWIDTAAGYGNGQSESNLGRCLAQLPASDNLHIATKVRIDVASSESIASQVQRSVEASLQRLRRTQLSLLQLHNGLTIQTGEEPASLSPAVVLRSDGVLEAMRRVQEQGLVGCLGLTGTGTAAAMRCVVNSGQFDTIQLPYNLLNPSAGQVMPADFSDRNYGNILADCLQQRMGAMAIRVLAAGAIVGAAPSAHTLKTPYFPLSLYQQDFRRAQALRSNAPSESWSLTAIRFALSHPAIHQAIVGFGCPEHVPSTLV